MSPTLPTRGDLARWAGSALLGAVVGVVGTGAHRMARPWGLLLALGLVLAAGVVARAWSGGPGMLAVGLGVAATTAALGTRGPGGDVLIAADVWGYVWYGGALVVLLAALAPRGWFREPDDEP